jgi:hypothetical protein
MASLQAGGTACVVLNKAVISIVRSNSPRQRPNGLYQIVKMNQ